MILVVLPHHQETAASSSTLPSCSACRLRANQAVHDVAAWECVYDMEYDVIAPRQKPERDNVPKL